MSRVEAPVQDGGIRAMGRLAKHLRELRDGAGYTTADLAEQLEVDVSTVRRDASGRTVPKLARVRAWAQACGAPEQPAVDLWRQAQHRYRQVTQERPRVMLPNPNLISRPEQLSDALEELYERAGAPTMREMAKHGSYGVLPRSTVHRIVHRQTLPVTEEQFRAYLTACHVIRPEPWIRAWHRVTRNPRRHPHPALVERLQEELSRSPALVEQLREDLSRSKIGLEGTGKVQEAAVTKWLSRFTVRPPGAPPRRP